MLQTALREYESQIRYFNIDQKKNMWVLGWLFCGNWPNRSRLVVVFGSLAGISGLIVPIWDGWWLVFGSIDLFSGRIDPIETGLWWFLGLWLGFLGELTQSGTWRPGGGNSRTFLQKIQNTWPCRNSSHHSTPLRKCLATSPFPHHDSWQCAVNG